MILFVFPWLSNPIRSIEQTEAQLRTNVILRPSMTSYDIVPKVSNFYSVYKFGE